jgi:hypothetical protein
MTKNRRSVMTRGGRHGSLTNHLLDRSRTGPPVIGAGATEVLWTDRNPFTVIEVADETHCTVQEDEAVRVSGSHRYDNKWDITPNTTGQIRRLSKRKDGRWKPVGLSDPSFLLGTRQKYYDPEF